MTPQIRVKDDTKKELERIKVHSRQSYNEVIKDLLELRKFLNKAHVIKKEGDVKEP